VTCAPTPFMKPSPRAPIEEDTLLVLLVLAFAGQNVSIASGSADGYAQIGRHAARLIGEDGKLAFDRDTLQQVARATLIDVLSCRENRSDSGVAARIAGDAVGADTFLPNMATDDFLSCLSRTGIEAVCKDTSVLPRQRVKDTRTALVQHYAENRFLHPAALFAPAPEKVAAWADKHGRAEDDEESGADALNESDEAEDVQPANGYAEAAE
jgi:ParB family chromosome partitioning protein